MRLPLLAILTAGFSTASIYPSENVRYYWDQPATGRYWVPDGTEPATIVSTSKKCGASTFDAVANHGIVPPGYAMHVFWFVGDNSAQARQCVLSNLRAVPQLKTYEARQ